MTARALFSRMTRRGGSKQPAAPNPASEITVIIRRQNRRSMMMRPVPGAYVVYIPRSLNPHSPTVRNFIQNALAKFNYQVVPIPEEKITRDQIRALMRTWAARLGVKPRRLTFREMDNKWGSCSNRGNLTLTTRLTWVEPRLAEYVVLHELIHLRVFNHGPEFYALMQQYMPDWKEREADLHSVNFYSVLD